MDGIDKKKTTELSGKERTYQFVYHTTKKNMITEIIDPRGNATTIKYNDGGTEANRVGQLTNREGGTNLFQLQ